ncbi:4-alpha-glucanotransferase, partial [Bordetella pertussis]
AHAQAAARAAGMGVGLIADLAVGVDPAGSQTWAQPDAMLGGLNVGAAPDLRHPGGQDWRLTACSPATLATQGYAAYIDMLRRALASAGGVRIDHVLGLARLWVIPEGASPDQGAYLAFPVEDLLRLAALEAWRHRAVLIGENLGTVPRDFNARLRAHGVLGMDVLWLQRETGPGGAGRFRPPGRWPASAVAMTSTHDLPTLRGWWQARDLDWCVPAHEADAQRRQRDQDRRALWRQAAPPGLAATAPPAEPPC